MTAQIIPVNFHSNSLFIVNHNEQPYTPMKQIVEGMGLRWQAQHRKLTSNAKQWGIIKMVIPSVDPNNEAICLPLRKLFGWLRTISPNKVKPELKQQVEIYQNECDDVLWSHWTSKAEQSAPNLKTKTTLPNGLTADQCDAIKSLVVARAERCPEDKRKAATIKLWSAVKSKFGCSYKEIAPEHFTEALSLVARIELEGEYIPRDELPPIDAVATLSIPGSSVSGLNLSDEFRKAISLKAYSLAHEAFELSIDHLTQRVAYEHGTFIKRGAANKDDVIATINAGTLGYALTYGMHEELERIANQAANMRHMAAQLEEKIRGNKPQLSAP